MLGGRPADAVDLPQKPNSRRSKHRPPQALRLAWPEKRNTEAQAVYLVGRRAAPAWRGRGIASCSGTCWRWHENGSAGSWCFWSGPCAHPKARDDGTHCWFQRRLLILLVSSCEGERSTQVIALLGACLSWMRLGVCGTVVVFNYTLRCVPGMMDIRGGGLRSAAECMARNVSSR